MSIYTQQHTVVTASEWAYRHLPAGSKLLSQDWDEGFPFSLPGMNPATFKVVNFGYYEPDSSGKMQRLGRELASSDYIVFQTKRLYGALTRAPEKFPLNTNYFYELFAGDLGYTLIHEVAARPSFFGFEIPDELGRRVTHRLRPPEGCSSFRTLDTSMPRPSPRRFCTACRRSR